MLTSREVISIKVTVDLPDELVTRLLELRPRRTLNEIMVEALEAYVEQLLRERPSRKQRP